MRKFIFSLFLTLGVAFSTTASAVELGDWSTQQKITVDNATIKTTLQEAAVLVRLHSGNFDFTTANIDGSDVRFVSEDGSVEYPFYFEKYDPANELAIAWVVLPEVAAGKAPITFTLLSGNENGTATGSIKALQTSRLAARYAFDEAALLQDSSASNQPLVGSVTAQKAGLIGNSAVLAGSAITFNVTQAVPNGYTWSTWLKPATLPQTGRLFAAGAINLAVEGDQLVLNAGATPSKVALKAGAWQHIALVVSPTNATVYVNGIAATPVTLSAVPATTAVTVADGLTGEIDEMQLVNVAQSEAEIAFAAKTQGAEASLVSVTPAGEAEGEEGEANYMGILINSLTLDAKVVIAILAVMFVISVWVMWSKGALVSRTDKDNKRFLERFQAASSHDLLKLDQGAQFKHSTLYGLYQAGLREIKKREHDGHISLGGASIDAIKAAVDADLVRETQRMNSMMVLLTIAISGGPFLGLLGTVVGVMITFAAIAAAGDVNVNAIAPGIAAALLATVAGLAVAIPALFGYNYLASRVKNITIAMQIFVDEFITRTAELYGKE